jgi:hypothetical protein
MGRPGKEPADTQVRARAGVASLASARMSRRMSNGVISRHDSIALVSEIPNCDLPLDRVRDHGDYLL